MGDGRRDVSRRGLIGAFGRGLQSLKDGLEDVQAAGSSSPPSSAAAPPPATPPPAPPAPSSGYSRILRPPDEMAFAESAGIGSWTLDLRGRALEVASSVIVSGGELPEHLILVRVHPHHYAACSAECPVDGSDLLWRHDDDRLNCPACCSQWRLDGEVTQGPADCHLARLVVDALEDGEGGVEVRVHVP